MLPYFNTQDEQRCNSVQIGARRWKTQFANTRPYSKYLDRHLNWVARPVDGYLSNGRPIEITPDVKPTAGSAWQRCWDNCSGNLTCGHQCEPDDKKVTTDKPLVTHSSESELRWSLSLLRKRLSCITSFPHGAWRYMIVMWLTLIGICSRFARLRGRKRLLALLVFLVLFVCSRFAVEFSTSRGGVITHGQRGTNRPPPGHNYGIMAKVSYGSWT